MLYEVSFIKKPTVREQEAGYREEILLPYTSVVADSKGHAVAVLAVANADKLAAEIGKAIGVYVRETGSSAQSV